MTHNGLNIMELESVHEAYKKELERVCEKHQIELSETELRHRNEIKRLCAENQSEISNVKQTLKSLYKTELDKIKNNHEHEIRELKEQFERHLNDLKDCDLDTLTKRIEDDITKTQVKHKKIVSYLVNEIYKLKKTMISSSFDDVDRLSSTDDFDSKLFRNNLNGHDTDIETSDYVLSQDSIDMQIKDLEDIVQERDDLRSVAMTLRQLSKYLCSFLINKQEELNNSIVERMNGMECGGIGNCGDHCTFKSKDKCENSTKARSPKKVHFVSNIEEIVSLIDENSILADFTNVQGINEEINHLELNACLEKLNEEAAALSDVINNEHCSNSEDIICNKTFIDKKLEYYKKELEKQKSDYKKLFTETSELEQENASLKEQLEKEILSVDSKKQCLNIENDNLILLQQKARELVKNDNDWPNFQNIFDEYYTECNRIIDNIRNEKDDIAQQLIVADRRLKSSQKFIKDQIAERETEREEFDLNLESLKCQLRDRERESLDSQDFRSHTEQVVTEAEERYLKLENRRLKTEELLKTSKLEVQSLKEIIHTMENRIENLIKNEMSQKNSINQLTNMIEEEQSNQQDMLSELNRLKNLLEEQSQSDCPELDIEIVINKIRLQLKDTETTISKRIKDLDTFWVSEECCSPMSEDISVAERCELPSTISIEKNSSPARIVATLDDVFIRLQERLNRLFKSEDAIFKHEADQQITANKLNKQIKSLESEAEMLRSRLAKKNDELTTAKMKIDELRVLKNDSVNSATFQLQEKLQKTTLEYKQCSQIIEEQKNEIKNLKDSTKYFRSMLSTYETKLTEKENIDPNAINNLESKIINLAQENMNLQIELKNKISQIETLSTQLSNLQSLQIKEMNQNVGGERNQSVSKSVMTDTHISENEQMRRAIPNESNTLASLQMTYHHQDVSIRDPSLLNLSLSSPLDKDNTNVQNSICEDLKSALANMKLQLEEKNALIKVMEKDAENMDQQLRELKEIVNILNTEKITLENRNRTLIESEAVLADKFSEVVNQLENKQETLAELETLHVKLRAEIQPLVFMKDNLEKKMCAFKDCNRIQSERIQCLENINEELIVECDQLKKNQKNVEEIKSLQQDNWTLKNELLNTEKFKADIAKKLEELKNEYDQLKSKNLALIDDIENFKLEKSRLKSELEKNKELYTEELNGYRNLLAEERNKKHQVNMELLKTMEELTNQASEQQKLISSVQENKECNATCTFLEFSSTSNPLKDTGNIFEIDLEYERKKNAVLHRDVEDKDAEIEHLNTIKKFQEEKLMEYMRRIQSQLDHNTELELIVTKLENHVKELENKIEIYRTKELNQENDDLVEKLEKDLAKVLDTNEMLDKELTRILDIKEETDQKLSEAYKQISEFETFKNKITVLLDELESKNRMNEVFKIQLNNAETTVKDQQAKADKDKRLFELKILDYQKKLKDSEQKYNEILNDYEVMKNYVIKKQQITDNLQLITEKNDNLELKLEDAEKNATEWQKKYNELLYENREVKNKFEDLDAECRHLQNKITELQNKLALSDHYKNRLKSDIQDITTPVELDLRNSKLIVNLETENASLAKKLTETREKYNKCRAHLEEIRSMLTSQNLKNVVQENIELCNTRDKLQKEVSDLKTYNQDLCKKLSEKDEHHWPVIGNQPITRVEALYHSLVWQKMYLVKLARGKDKLLRFIIQECPDLDNSTVKTIMQRICAKRKMSKFKIVTICLIAIRRIKMVTLKRSHSEFDVAHSQLDVTHKSLPRKMPWIKC